MHSLLHHSRELRGMLTGVFAWCLFYGTLAAQPVRVTPTDQEIRIGEQVTVWVRVHVRPQDRVQWPIYPDTLGSKHVELISASPIDTLIAPKISDSITLEQKLVITSFDSGLWVVTPFTFMINADTIQSEAFLLSVQTIEVDTTEEIKDIKPLYDVGYTWKEILWIAAKYAAMGWGGLGTAAVIAFLLGKTRKPNREKPVVHDPITLHEATIRQLEELKREELWQHGKYKEYHVRLSEIVREYLEKRFEVQALESTTDEIKQQLASLSLTQELREAVIRALRISDLAKFAKARPLAAENEFSLATAFELVEATKPTSETETSTQADPP